MTRSSFAEKGPHRPALVRTLLALSLLATVVMGISAARLAARSSGGFSGTVYPDAPPAPEFTLTDHRGEPRSLSDFRGRAVLLFFGFTRCPDVCPMTLAKLSRVLAEAGLPAGRVQILLITVDPEHDTPDRLAAYVQAFGDSVVGLTGGPHALRQLFAAYGVYAEPAIGHHGDETIAHTTLVFGIDRSGRLRVLIRPDEPGHIVEGDIRSLLRLRD
jgi:protein SCO1